MEGDWIPDLISGMGVVFMLGLQDRGLILFMGLRDRFDGGPISIGWREYHSRQGIGMERDCVCNAMR